MTDHDAADQTAAEAGRSPVADIRRGTADGSGSLHPGSWKPVTRWRVGIVAAFLLVSGATRSAPYAVVTPGVAVDLMAAVSSGAIGAVDPSFGRGGTFLAMTIEASATTYASATWCDLKNVVKRASCDLYPLDISGSNATSEADAMAASQRAADAEATRLAGPAPAYPSGSTAAMGAVAGSSAGLMLALAMLDARTTGDLTGGARVAGTGTLGPGGAVQPIGGITHKVAVAAAARASVFFAPSSQAPEAAAAARALGAAMTVVPVASTDAALGWLCAHGGVSTACPTQPGPAKP